MAVYKIKYTPESLTELQLIIDYYKNISPGLGKKFKENFLAALSKIKSNPFYPSIRYDEVRLAVVNRFPYAAHYIINKENNTVIVLAVLGFKQDKDNRKIE